MLVLAHFDNQVHGLEVIFTALSFLILLIVPVVFMIPTPPVAAARCSVRV